MYACNVFESFQPIMKWPKTSRNPSTAQGLTRADLMACVALMAVLTAVAASALSSSKDNASRVVCGSNLRQMALAEGMYAGENRDYLAFCNWDGGDMEQPGGGWLYTLPNAGGDSIPNPFAAPWSTHPQSAWTNGLWWPYVLNANSYLCPVDIQSSDYKGLRNNKLSSYLMNGAACGFGQVNGGQLPFPTCKVSDVWSPRCYLLWEVDENALGPDNPGAFDYNDGASYPTAPPEGGEGLGSLHGNNGGEVVSVGGSVSFVTLKTFQAQAAATGTTNLAWWSPFGVGNR